INGKKYGFDEYGRMIADWYTKDATEVDGSATEASASQGYEEYTETFMYFSSPEDGARYTKGWFKVVPGYYLHQAKYEDGDSYWYYADGKGHIVASEIKTIKSKKYLFDNYGRMKKGLQLVQFPSVGETKQVDTVYADDDSSYPYDTEDNFDATAKLLKSDLESGLWAFMFFSNDEDHDGSMKSGKQQINIDGDNFTFKFYNSGSRKGQGITGYDDKKLYIGGKLISADSDEKINFYNLTDGKKYTVAALIKEGVLTSYNGTDKHAKRDEAEYRLGSMDADEFAKTYVCINTSGAILTSGTKKDGDDYKIHLTKAANAGSFGGKTFTTASISYVILK
ncbi:MAG: cell wall-binding protein, partial [Stomatobaculum sp.]|nr:cell wall-binding protein [Stomatobaculum sp.]